MYWTEFEQRILDALNGDEIVMVILWDKDDEIRGVSMIDEIGERDDGCYELELILYTGETAVLASNPHGYMTDWKLEFEKRDNDESAVRADMLHIKPVIPD